MEFSRAVDQIIGKHLDELRKPGVLSVRPGYQAAGGWLTKKPAIVVTVSNKRDDLPPQDRLPEMLEGFPVDVRESGALHRMRAVNPGLFASIAVAARPELERPTFPFERDLSGQGLDATLMAAAALRRPDKPKLENKAPAGAPLDAVESKMTITCHASPDAGWPTLKPFLQKTAKTLTVGMYDFTSAHILAIIKTSCKSKKLKLVLDHPAPNPTRDQTDDETLSALEKTLGADLSFAWALERANPNAAAWIYPNAYHIKVAVRDGTAFWLSSGNWNNSNQPDIDPVANPQGSLAVARKSDRDWHVIVENKELAGLFEKYLANDLKVAQAHQVSAAGMAAMNAALGELAGDELNLTPKKTRQFFKPKTITATMKIQPLLTPDNYCDHILPLINSAKRSFFMQTQYIHPSDAADSVKLSALIRAVSEKIAAGLDVRIIMSQFETMDKLELLQDAGLDPSHLRIQQAVHNKGIIVDSKVAVVSSQNWSGVGVASNRDAGLIVFNEEAAKYWEEIFIHDWTNLASQHALD